MKTFECFYRVGALRGWFLIGASNFRAARAHANEYLHRCGILPVEVLKVTLKLTGLQLTPGLADRPIDPPALPARGFSLFGNDDRIDLGLFFAQHRENA